jgi:hypothetical protein
MTRGLAWISTVRCGANFAIDQLVVLSSQRLTATAAIKGQGDIAATLGRARPHGRSGHRHPPPGSQLRRAGRPRARTRDAGLSRDQAADSPPAEVRRRRKSRFPGCIDGGAQPP